MKYYANIVDNKINGIGQVVCVADDLFQIEISQEVYNNLSEHPNMYIYQNGAIVLNPNYEQEEEEKRRQAHIAELKQQLNEIDSKSARSLRAIVAGTATDADRAYLAELERQAEEIRGQL